MGINFPASPVVGDLYPVPPQAGVPQYKWDGTVWVANVEQPLTYVKRTGDTMTGFLKLHADPAVALDVAPKQYVDAVRAYAAPFDTMAYSGMQINGGFQIQQEKVLGTSISVSGFVCDGWNLGKGGTAAIQAYTYFNAAVPGLTHSYQMSVQTAQASMAAGDYFVTYHNIEGYRTTRLAWGTASAKPITIAFWSAHARVGLFSGFVRNLATTRSYIFTYTQAVSGVPQYNVITIPGCIDGVWATDHTIGIGVGFTAACGSTYTAPSANTWNAGNYFAAPGQVNSVAATSDLFSLLGVVILPGSLAPTAAQSPSITRPYNEELPICQRYYERTICGGRFYAAAGGHTLDVPAYWKVTKRITPTAVITGAGTRANLASLLIPAAWVDASRFQLVSQAAGECYALGELIVVDARL